MSVDFKIVWNGEVHDLSHPSTDTVEKVITDFVTKNAQDLIEEIPQFQLRRLTNSLHALDTKQSLARNGVKSGDKLLLTKALIHHQTRDDKRVAAAALVYTVFFFSIAMIALINVWPNTPDQLSLNANRTYNVTLPILISHSPYVVLVTNTAGPEVLLLFIMILSGVIGACIYSLYAIALHLGSYQDFDYAWTGWYLTRPWIGAGLSFTLYLLIRSGILTTNVGNLNLMGLAGISILAGLFTENIMHKLNDLVDTLFGPGPNPSNTASKT